MQTQTAQLEPFKSDPIAPIQLDPGSCSVKTGSCCGVKSCGPKPASPNLVKKPAGLSDEIFNRIKNHPCYSEEAHHHYARMHVAVAPACNIQCNYCNRKFDCANESRPGVVSEKLTPEEALRKVLTVASKVQRLSVLGIAGPGDPLANPEKTFRTFDLIARNAPDLKLCLSTNGLRLPDYIDEIKKYNIEHVTITINMIDPEIGSRIYPWIFYDHRRITGREASAILSANQLRGLELLTENGILAKINSVMIPGVNDEHLLEVNRAVNERGAFLHNVMPLISAHEHGTHYGLNGQRGPTDLELMGLQNSLKSDMRLMKHCRQCRADAVGLLGEDRSQEFTMERLGDGEVAYDLNARSEFHREVEREQSERLIAKAASEKGIKEHLTGLESFLVAVATKGGGRVNEHFGHVAEFQVYEVSATGIEFVAHRKVENFCQGRFGDAENLDGIVESIRDCRAVFASKIGECPRWDLAQAGIEPVDGYADEHIESAILKYINSKKQL